MFEGWKVKRAVARIERCEKKLKDAHAQFLKIKPKNEDKQDGPTTIGDLLRQSKVTMAGDENYALDVQPKHRHNCPSCDLDMSECDCPSDKAVLFVDEDADVMTLGTDLSPYDAHQIWRALDQAGISVCVCDEDDMDQTRAQMYADM